MVSRAVDLYSHNIYAERSVSVHLQRNIQLSQREKKAEIRFLSTADDPSTIRLYHPWALTVKLSSMAQKQIGMLEAAVQYFSSSAMAKLTEKTNPMLEQRRFFEPQTFEVKVGPLDFIASIDNREYGVWTHSLQTKSGIVIAHITGKRRTCPNDFNQALQEYSTYAEWGRTQGIKEFVAA